MARFKNWVAPDIQDNVDTKYGWRVSHSEQFRMGDRVDIGYGCYLMSMAGILIGDDVQIGGGCYIYSVSTIDETEGPVIIKEGACIGSNSVVMPGVTIGKGAIVGAMSFVNRDIPAGVTAYGVPARIKGESNDCDCWGKRSDWSGDSLVVP